jgi:hypothetical protein
MTKYLIPQIKIRRFLPIAKEILRLVLLDDRRLDLRMGRLTLWELFQGVLRLARPPDFLNSIFNQLNQQPRNY